MSFLAQFVEDLYRDGDVEKSRYSRKVELNSMWGSIPGIGLLCGYHSNNTEFQNLRRM